ncbi:MAG: serine/threonine-protein kinase [Planctomycetota bacterium]|nr:serine/threonine-protein kinase [Planctomycetota bacterium]
MDASNQDPYLTPPTPKRPARSAGRPGRPESDIPAPLPLEDLTGDVLLESAPRVMFQGQIVPSLGGIPLLAQLGRGSMAAIYLGIDPGLGIEVAVKVLKLRLAQPDMIKSFQREARLAAKVESPHLVYVKDVSEENGLHYFVMEYVPGMTASAYLRQVRDSGRAGLSETEALAICIAATEGLAVAHRKGIIHRDVKPENILIPNANALVPAEARIAGDEGKRLVFSAAKLADLGLAHAGDASGGFGSAGAAGTPGYMAPEQATDPQHAFKPADVFGLGATLYTLLAGDTPFRGNDKVEVVMNTVHKPHLPLRKSRPDLSAATLQLVEQCLDKDPASRFPDASALLEALQSCRAAPGQYQPSPSPVLDETPVPLVELPAETADTVPGASARLSGRRHAPSPRVSERTLFLLIVGVAALIVLVLLVLFLSV